MKQLQSGLEHICVSRAPVLTLLSSKLFLGDSTTFWKLSSEARAKHCCWSPKRMNIFQSDPLDLTKVCKSSPELPREWNSSFHMYQFLNLRYLSDLSNFTFYNYRKKWLQPYQLTNVMMSFAKSLARSGVTKQDKPVSATPVSYWLGLLRSWKKRNRLKNLRSHRMSRNNFLRLILFIWHKWSRASASWEYSYTNY